VSVTSVIASARSESAWQHIGSRLHRLFAPLRTSTPTVLQMERAECGAASLGMILAHYGLWVPLEKLREACGVSRDGSKASNILKAARRFGLAAKGFRKDITSLSELPLPAILHWNFNHFVVLERLNSKHAYINDPAVGRRRIELEELDAAFTGVVLAMQPAPDFARGGSKPAFFRILARTLANSTAAIGLVIALSIALVIPTILIPAFSKIFVDDVLMRHMDSWLTPLLIGMAVTAVGRGLIVALQQSLLLRIETKLTVTMTSRFVWHVMSLPMEFFTNRHAGDIANRVSANEQIAQLLSNGLAGNALNLVSLIIIAGAMAVYDVSLASVSFGIAVLNVAILKLLSRRREDINRKLVLERGKLDTSTIEIVRSIETIKASGLEGDAFARWAGFQAKVLNAEQELGFYAAILEICPTLLTGLTVAIVIGVGGLRLIDGALTIGSLVAFQALLASLVEPINAFVQQTGHFQIIKSNMFRLEDVFNYPRQKLPIASANIESMPPKLSGRIELRDIRFGYSMLEGPLIDGFSLTIEPGSRVAIVGQSGSGKSTIGRLVAGLYTPWSGEIFFDSWKRSAIPSDIFANSVAYVDQDIYLFEGSIRDNLTLWDDLVPEADITRALKDALVHDDIATRAGNYDCQVAEDGRNFSGGQRQRIEIARALVGNPSVLILDEATSALDPTIETQIDDNLRRRGCTCIIIAHRLSTIRDCDEIIVLREGKVVQRGTHDELFAAGGEYAQLVLNE